MKTKIVLLIIVICSAFMAYKFWYYIPPMTPSKLVRIVSCLKIPKNTKPAVFEEENTFTGEGYLYMVFDFDSIKARKFIAINKKKLSDFCKLPINFKMPPVPDELYNYMSAKMRNEYYPTIKQESKIYFFGIYKLERIKNSQSFNITIFDKKSNKLFVYSYHD